MKMKMIILKGGIFLSSFLILLLCFNTWAGASSSQENLVKNSGFEEGFAGWLHQFRPAGASAKAIVGKNTSFGGKCIIMETGSGTSQAIAQTIGELIPGEDYIFSAIFKTTPAHFGYIAIKDWDWKNSKGARVTKSFGVAIAGDNNWKTISRLVHIPLKDDFGESTEGHRWNIYLYGHYPTTNKDVVHYDDVCLKLGGMYLPRYGCANDANSRSVDFGASDEMAGGIKYDADVMTSKEHEGNINFRAIKPKKTLTVEFPAFNVDEGGFPLTPMLLEVSYKDTIDDMIGRIPGSYRAYHRAFIDSFINYTNADAYVNKDRLWYGISYLGEFGDGIWRYMQFPFQKTSFQLLRAINGKFTIRIKMPAGFTGDDKLHLPIDYISLRSISQEECSALNSKQRGLRGFYEVEVPETKSDVPRYYRKSNLIVFVRDIMRPVYKHTKPSRDEINKDLSTATALGEIEPLSFSICSQTDIKGLSIEVSDLINKQNDYVISKNNINILKVVYDEKRLASSKGMVTFGLVPDRIEECPILDIPKNTAQRIWLNLHVPKDIAGGQYKGKVNIKKDDMVLKSLDVKLDVLPLELDRAQHLNSIYHDPYNNTISNSLEEVYKFYREYGFTPFTAVHYKGSNNSKGIEIDDDDKDGLIEFNDDDVKDFVITLDRMIEEGIINDKVILYVGGYMWREIVDAEGPYESKDLHYRLSTQKFIDAYGGLIKKLIEIGSNRGITFIFEVIDEPLGVPSRRIISDRLYRIVKENNGLTTVTYDAKCENEIQSGEYITPNGKIPPLTELVDYKIWNTSAQGYGYTKGYENYGFYGSTAVFRNPIYGRFIHGLLAFRTDAKAVSGYAMDVLINDPYNDFDAHQTYKYPFTYPDYIFGYPTWSGKLIPTMSAEGIKEGIKDAKYIATLKRLIRENPFSPVSEEATQYLVSIKQRINPDFKASYYDKSGLYGYYEEILRDISESRDPCDFEAFTKIRNKIINYIQQLL